VTGYQVRVDGQSMVIGGTSAVAPLWAGLIALNNQQNGKSAGFIQPQIYAAKAASGFRDIVSGNNGTFSAGPGWDGCTGLGSPIGSKIIALLGASGKKPVRTRPAKKKLARRVKTK
jgi:kumamolisin